MKLSKLWILGLLLWLLEAFWITCYGRLYGSIDWYHYFHIANWTHGRLLEGYLPFQPGRTVLTVGLWSFPFLWIKRTFWSFQIAMVLANSLVLPATWLWAKRLGGEGAACIAAWLVILSAGYATVLTCTTPYPLSAALLLFAVYAWRVERPILAAVLLFLALQAHASAGLYCAAFLAVAVLERRWRAWAVACCLFALLTAWWLWELHAMFGHEGDYWWVNAGWVMPGVTSKSDHWTQQWLFFKDYVYCGFYPVDMIGKIRAVITRWPDAGIDPMAAQLTSTWATILPVIASVALVIALVKRRIPAWDWTLVGSLVGGSWLTWVFVQHPLGYSIVPHTQLPAVLVVFVLAATVITALPTWLRRGLWVASVLQWVLGTMLWLGLAHLGDPYNLELKRDMGVVYLSDLVSGKKAP